VNYTEALPSWWPANAVATETVPSLVSTTEIMKEITIKQIEHCEGSKWSTINQIWNYKILGYN